MARRSPGRGAGHGHRGGHPAPGRHRVRLVPVPPAGVRGARFRRGADHLPRPGGGQPDAAQAGGTIYPSEADKYQKAAAAFDEVAQKHGSTAPGARARYYAALAKLELGQNQAAEAELNKLASDGDALMKGLARLALADMHRGAGQWDQAVDAYRKIVDDSGSAVPRDHALMRLAGTLEEAKRTPDALASYRRLVDEFPASVYAPEARRKVDVLGGRA